MFQTKEALIATIPHIIHEAAAVSSRWQIDDVNAELLVKVLEAVNHSAVGHPLKARLAGLDASRQIASGYPLSDYILGRMRGSELAVCRQVPLSRPLIVIGFEGGSLDQPPLVVDLVRESPESGATVLYERRFCQNANGFVEAFLEFVIEDDTRLARDMLEVGEFAKCPVYAKYRTSFMFPPVDLI